MRAIASITGLLAMLFIGGTIGGLIFGAPEIWGTSLALLGLDAIIGMTAQYFADREDARFIQELAMIAKEVEEEEKARQVAQEDWKEEIEEEEDMILSEDFFDDGFEVLTDDVIQTIVDDLKNNAVEKQDLIAKFDENYYRIKAAPRCSCWVDNITQDASGALLLDVCASMPYAPRYGDIYHLIGVCATDAVGTPALVYAIAPSRGGIQYTYLCLVCTKEKAFRLFSAERSNHCIYFCEFLNGRHINYGELSSEMSMPMRVREILQSESKNKT